MQVIVNKGFLLIAAALLLLVIAAIIWIYKRGQSSKTPIIEPEQNSQASELEKSAEKVGIKPKNLWEDALKKSREPLLARLGDVFATLSGQETW